MINYTFWWGRKFCLVYLSFSFKCAKQSQSWSTPKFLCDLLFPEQNQGNNVTNWNKDSIWWFIYRRRGLDDRKTVVLLVETEKVLISYINCYLITTGKPVSEIYEHYIQHLITISTWISLISLHPWISVILFHFIHLHWIRKVLGHDRQRKKSAII